MGKTRSGRRYGPIQRYRPYALGGAFTSGIAAGRAIVPRIRNALSGSMTMTRSRQRMSSGTGITTQHDRRQVYRKRNMPRRKKRRWKKFINRVHAVAEKELGSRTWLANNSIVCGNYTANQQGVLTLALYPLQSTNNWLNDLNTVAGLENVAGNPTTAAGITLENSTKLLFQSAIHDVTIRNTSFVREESGTPLDSRAKLELDIYEISASKDFVNATTSYGNLGSLFNTEEAFVKVLNASGSTIKIDSRGATPFEIPFALGRYGVKIWKKTKFFIPNGDTITYQVRDPKRRVSTIKDLSNENGANKPKWTRFLFIFFKIVPGLTIGAQVGEYGEQITVGSTRKYFYKVEGANDDRDRYDAGTASVTSPN